MTILTTGSASTARVLKALDASGYGTDGIKSAKFVGVNDHGDEVHEIFFWDHGNDKWDRGNVYVSRTSDDRLVGEF